MPSAVSREALLMRENKAQGHTSERRSPCEINHLFGGASCVEAAEEKVDGLVLCERHALEVKLEGQIECWGGILFHIELWSREATRRDQATSARQLARTDLDRLRSRDTSLGTLGSAERVLRRGPLKIDPLNRGSLPLPPRGARQLS